MTAVFPLAASLPHRCAGSKPGSRISLGSASTTTGYDVTYKLDGEERVVRMDERPSVDRFRVVDGQVITKG